MERKVTGNDNVDAWRLGEIALQAGGQRDDVGDFIDRGLILIRLLKEKGYTIVSSNPGEHP